MHLLIPTSVTSSERLAGCFPKYLQILAAHCMAPFWKVTSVRPNANCWFVSYFIKRQFWFTTAVSSFGRRFEEIHYQVWVYSPNCRKVRISHSDPNMVTPSRKSSRRIGFMIIEVIWFMNNRTTNWWVNHDQFWVRMNGVGTRGK